MTRLMWVLTALVGLGVVAGTVALFALPDLRQHLASDDNGSSRPDSEVTSVEGKQEYHITSDGVEREFIVYRPENLDADEEVPVVFMFHGSGQSGELFYRESGWKDKADQEGFMVVYPTALKFHVFSDEKIVKGKLETDVAVYQTKWNSYELPSLLDPKYPNQTLHDDVQFTKDMVAFLDDNYAVDSDRMYATGFSNGGQFVTRLAVEMSDTFAAFAPTSAGRVQDEVLAKLDELDKYPTPRPVIQVIGANDEKANFSSGVEDFDTDESVAADGYPIKDNYIANFLALEQLKDDYTYEYVNRSGHFTYAESEVGADNEYQFYVVDGMGHIYPNENNFRTDITDVYWPFFEQYSL